MIVISAPLVSGLRFIDPQGGVTNLGADPGWALIPGTNNRGLLYNVPTGEGRINQLALVLFRWMLRWHH